VPAWSTRPSVLFRPDFRRDATFRAGAARSGDEALMAPDAPEALLTELERARTAYARAELRARTYLVEQGTLEQTTVDASAALRKARKVRDSRPAGSAGRTQDG
jgi:hypothetical protein